MKVKELIEKLQRCNPEAIVVTNAYFEFIEVTSVDSNFADGFDSLPADSEFRKFGPSVVEII